MSSKQRREKSYNIHGMRSILSVFTSRHRFVILNKALSILMDELGAHWLFIRYLKQFGYIKQRKIRNGKVHRHKKSLFISNESHSVTISGVLDYILESTRYKQFPQKKKKKKLRQIVDPTRSTDRRDLLLNGRKNVKRKCGLIFEF